MAADHVDIGSDHQTRKETGVDPDGPLVRAAKTDRAAFGELYIRYVDSIYRYCYRRLGSREAAEDATSQVFTKAMSGLPSYCEGIASFRSWLFAIAHNELIDGARKHRWTFSLDAAIPVVDTTPGPEEQLLHSETAASIHSLLAQMTTEQRRVIELRMAGLTNREIAVVLDRRPEAIRALQFRALEKLRSQKNLLSVPDGGSP